MIELELLGTSADGESLVLTDAQGERYSVLISDELRGATRRDRPRVELAPARPTLAPRDIQALLRAGATPHEIASEHGMEVGAVQRFEAPVQAEKDYALTRARAVRVGDGGPTMGDLVVDRLAARGVDPASLEWAATREAGEPWQIIVTFVQGAAEHAAHWHLSSSGSLEAIDQEAQWLTEQVSVSPTASIFTPLPRTAPTPAPDPDEEDLRNREAIVDQLNAVRGKRQQIDLGLDDEVDEEAEYLAAIAGEDEPEVSEPEASTGPISARIYSLASARTKAETPAQPADDALFPATGQIPSARPAATGSLPVASRSGKNEAPASSGVLPWLAAAPASSQDEEAAQSDCEEQPTPAIPMKAVAPADSAAPAKAEEGATGAVPSHGVAGSRMARSSSKKNRRSVPSWDEILFGSKS
ncbi:MAG: septation protein SepH [Schaalia odontolytica]